MLASQPLLGDLMRCPLPCDGAVVMPAAGRAQPCDTDKVYLLLGELLWRVLQCATCGYVFALLPSTNRLKELNWCTLGFVALCSQHPTEQTSLRGASMGSVGFLKYAAFGLSRVT